MKEKTDFTNFLKNLESELPNPFKKRGFKIMAAESFIEGGSNLHKIDGLEIDYSKDLRAEICFKREDTILVLAVISFIVASHCTLDGTV